jgi:alpha-L-arabinofuranosidase
VIVVNKDRKRSVRATLRVKGRAIKRAVVKRLVGPSFVAYNSASHPNRVSIHTDKRSVRGRKMRLGIVPHSVTTVELRRFGKGG